MRFLYSGVGRDSHGYLSGRRWQLYQILLPFTFFIWPVILGWIVARTHRARQAAMVLAFVASVALYAAWDLTVHYSQMKSCVQCVPDAWVTNLVLNCVNMFGILFGGLLAKPKQTHPPR
jgi:hypothetical protein